MFRRELLQNRTPNSNRNPLRNSKAIRPTPEAGRGNRLLSPRTRVTELSIASRYRFFSKGWRKMAHANFSQWDNLAPQVLSQAARINNLFTRGSASSSCGYAFPAALRSHFQLLLPLRGIQGARRLREDVRVQEIRVSLVGHQLRQAAHEHAPPRFSRRPALPASRPRRTRTLISATRNVEHCHYYIVRTARKRALPSATR